MYSNLVTPYALEFILKDIRISLTKCYDIIPSENNTYILMGGSQIYTCTVTSCTCNCLKKMCLPCRHIFCLRRNMKLSLYDDYQVHRGWKTDYYQQCAHRFQVNNRTK